MLPACSSEACLLVRTQPDLSVSIGQGEFLNPLTGTYFAGIEVSMRVHGDRVDHMELTRHRAVTPDRTHQGSGFAVMDPDLVIVAVRDQNVFLSRVMREGEIVGVSAAPGCAATIAATGGRRGIHEETAHELALLGKNLNAIAAAFTHVDQAVD